MITLPPIDIEQVYRKIVLSLRRFFNDAGTDKAVVGLSGGIDSAVVMALACQALGKDNVHGILMPSPFSTLHSISDAVDLADNLQASYTIIPIEKIYQKFIKETETFFNEDHTWSVTEENIQARIRGVILMAYSNEKRALVLNTSNKSEISVGYGTLYGDLCGALMVLADLYKLQVYNLAAYINRNQIVIPKSIIIKPPSAELKPEQKDTDSLPEYSLLDPILYALHEDGKRPEELITEGIDNELIDKIMYLKKGSAFKVHQIPPILQIGEKPLGNSNKWIKFDLP